MGGLQPILNLQVISYKQIPTFKMLPFRQVWQHIQKGDCAFSTDLKDDYLHIPTAEHHQHIFVFFSQNNLTSERFCQLGL